MIGEKETNSIDKSNNTDIVDSFLNEEGGREKLELLLREERFSAELFEHNPIADKIDGEHISKYLEGSEKNMLMSFEDKNKQRKFYLIIFGICVLSIFGFIILLKDEQELLKFAITSLVSLGAGAFGGYGIGKRSSSD